MWGGQRGREGRKEGGREREREGERERESYETVKLPRGLIGSTGISLRAVASRVCFLLFLVKLPHLPQAEELWGKGASRRRGRLAFFCTSNKIVYALECVPSGNI